MVSMIYGSNSKFSVIIVIVCYSFEIELFCFFHSGWERVVNISHILLEDSNSYH